MLAAWRVQHRNSVLRLLDESFRNLSVCSKCPQPNRVYGADSRAKPDERTYTHCHPGLSTQLTPTEDIRNLKHGRWSQSPSLSSSSTKSCHSFLAAKR